MSYSKRFLVVDDDGITETMKDILKESDFIVDTANNGFDAIDFTNNKNYDVILMDIKMPKLNGIETCKKMNEVNQKKVIFITAYLDDEKIIEIKKDHHPFIYKPINFDDLQKLIKSII